MNAEKAASTMRWRAGVSSERGWRRFAVACVGMILLDSVPIGTIASKQLVPNGTKTKQNTQGGPHGKTSPRHFSGRRQAGQDRAARIRNAAQARDSGSRLCPQDRRTFGTSARARRRYIRRRLPRRPLGAAQGAVRLPWGKEQTVLPLVAGEDVARVAVGLLTSPSLTAGTAYPVIGTVISLKEIIATFARVLAKNVRYQEISDEQWRSEALARGLNAHALEHLSSLWKALRAAGLDPERARFAVTDAIEKLGGAKPKTFEAFVREGQSGLMAKSA